MYNKCCIHVSHSVYGHYDSQNRTLEPNTALQEELPYCTQSLTGSGTRRVVADNIERDAAAVNLHEVVLADRSKNLIR